MNILGIIPARGGSKGIPDKNMYPLRSRPMIDYTFEASKKSRLLTRTILTSDSQEIIALAFEKGIEAPFVRPAELARDDTPAFAFIDHAVSWLECNESYIPDYIVVLQPTSPLRLSKHIDETVEKLIASDADSIVSVVEVPHTCNPYSVMKLSEDFLVPFLPYDENKNLRQLKPKFYARNGAIYAFTYNCLKQKKSFYGNKVAYYIMKKQESIDVNDMFDLKMVEYLLSEREMQLG